ncbi:tetratricopeptide repeat protein [Stygiobacter electus]|uniref:Tetratricopeptide repeat protein n=1 Tax=Stygiobacter electus TaxID=3032292 RepID=A0AAE3NXQ7_9BACT|nr:tetratricopeptide repeat protein [Stygiobacter electus]MDF1610709.1 tetratricopeptide repeat protein [Stygiobacter electus]
MNYSFKIIFIVLFVSSFYYAQENVNQFKREGLMLMKEGRYGEAIDQFNKYIAGNPRSPDGYHIRGLCQEQRSQFQNAVLDLRRAYRLDPSNQKVKEDLNRVTTTWHKLLYQKIEGHKRDIAKDPKYAFSYLEIGKSYRWLEEWKLAERWYDEYLKRDDNASPDEIIRYTEILAKTRSIVKGERILKKYTDRYPEDWRLWSRYGYFTLWLGKNKIAENAFENSLKFKPFFKEAEDGLDLSRKQGYLTVDMGKDYTKAQEYAIDKFFRVLDQNPEDDETRFNLVEELISNDRYEEAYQQIQILQTKHSEEERFKQLYSSVKNIRDSLYNENVNKYTERLKENPLDKEAVIKVAESYGNLFYYDNAIEILQEYLQNIEKDKDLDIRYLLAKYKAWNFDFEEATQILDNILKYDPNNLDYQLLRGQIAIWTLNDLELGEQYLKNVLSDNEYNLDALLSMVNLYTWKKDFNTAKIYLEKLEKKYPVNPEVIYIRNIYELRFQANEEAKVFEIRGEAGKLSMNGDCQGALLKYDEYFQKRKSLTNEEKFEYADIATCAKNYQKAIDLYNEILNAGFDFKAALLKAQNLFSIGDTTEARTELESLAKLKPDDIHAKMLLADTYTAIKKFNDAEKLYREVLSDSNSTYTKNDIYQKMIFLAGSLIDDKQFEKGKKLYEEIYNSTVDSNLKEQIDQRMILYADQLAADKNYKESLKEFKSLEEKIKDQLKLKDIYSRQIYISYLMVLDKKLDQAEDLLESLSEKVNDDSLLYNLNQKKLFLADTYLSDESYGSARNIYEDVLETAKDTSQIRMAKERIGWLPPSGLIKGLHGFGSFINYFLPMNMNIAPFATYYKDNQNLRFWNYGSRFEFGFLGFISLGVLWSRSTLDNTLFQKDFIQLRGLASIYFSNHFSVSGSLGRLNTLGEPNYNVWDAQIRYQIPDELNLSFSYDNTDPRIFFYSPYLLNTRIKADVYRFNYWYNYKNILRIYGFYNYFELSDNNKGNDFQIRIGKRFLNLIVFGYEYMFSDYQDISPLYYSPQNYDTHSLWAEYDYIYKKDWKFKIGGKVGYSPDIDFIISEGFGEVNYNPVTNVILYGRVGYTNSFRFGTGYRSLNISFSAYISVF